MDKFRRKTDEPSTSMVLLLREYHFFTKGEFESAAEKAWGRSFTDRGEKSRHFVTQSGFVTMIKVGPHVLNILHVNCPYMEEMDEAALQEFLPEKERQEAWRQHRAWVAVDYLNEETDEETKYCVLANLVAEIDRRELHWCMDSENEWLCTQ
jgi:hypothetical protein